MRYGRFTLAGEPVTAARLGVLAEDPAAGADTVLDLTALATDRPDVPAPLVAGSLDPLLAAGRPAWDAARRWLADVLAGARADPGPLARHRHPLEHTRALLPFTVADYLDFFACEQHAVNAARIFRPGDEPLTPNWRHHPVGYHGRAGTVLPSGTPVTRPNGQRGAADFGPTRLLDFEAELGFVLGGASTLGEPVPIGRALDHVFGVVLLNDWSARDIQFWESRPLGPLLGKAFATSISAWVTPLPELAAAWVDPPPRDPEPLDYLRGPDDRGLDLALQVALNGEVISRPPAAALYWTPAQLVTHLTSGGATVRPGDLLGSGTLSGPDRAQRGCLLELSWGGREPLTLADGSELAYLRDGDELVITASAPAVGGGRLDLGEVRGRVLPARS